MPSIEVTHQSGHSLHTRSRSVCVHRFNAAKTCDADASITALPERDCGEHDNQVNTLLAPRSALSAKHEAPMKNRAKGHGGMESVATRGAAARGRVHGRMHGAQAWPQAWRACMARIDQGVGKKRFLSSAKTRTPKSISSSCSESHSATPSTWPSRKSASA